MIHTPTPWRIGAGCNPLVIETLDGSTIAELGMDWASIRDEKIVKANAALIVECVNEYETLKKLLSDTLTEVSKMADGGVLIIQEMRRLKLLNMELAGALVGVIKIADRKTDEFDRAKAALAKAGVK